MSDRGATPTAGIAPGGVPPAEGVDLTSAFNALRDELVSTLWFIVGNRDDAQDAAQEAFLKCWKARENLATIENLRAWIFRVALNTARDLRRSAWRRKVRPLVGEDPMYVDAAKPPGERLDRQEEVE